MTAPVVVVGGGFTGLVAAYRLRRLGIDVELLEASDRLGGKIRTEHLDGMRVELGPDSFLWRDPIMVTLCDEIGLSDHLVSPVGFGAQVWLEDGLRRLPSANYFGMPLDVEAARRSGILSGRGALRARFDRVLPMRRRREDIAVGALVRSRFGREVLERMVDPILAGTRAGDLDQISVQSALPEAWAAVRRGHSITREIGSARTSEASAPPFYGLRRGMDRLVEALLAAAEGVVVRTSTSATNLRHRDGDGYLVETSAGTLPASGVIVTSPPRTAAAMLQHLAADAAQTLRTFAAADVVIAPIAFPGELRLPEGSGLLVPSSQGRTLTGATWYSRKWPQGASSNRTVIRCFAGRTDGDELPDDDEALVKTLVTDLADAVGELPEPMTARVQRWSEGLPIYSVGHNRRMHDIELALSAHPEVRLAGAAYRGSGLPDCARQALNAADSVAATLGVTGR